MNQLIDLARYPIDQLKSGAGRDLIEICHNNLATQAIVLLPGFIRPRVIADGDGCRRFDQNVTRTVIAIF